MAFCWNNYHTLGVVVVAVLIMFLLMSSGNDECCDDCGGVVDCSSDPFASDSCCNLNPVIKKQCEELRRGSCNCIVNIGSMYLGASVATIRDTVTYNHPLGRLPASALTNRPDLALDVKFNLLTLPSKVLIGKNWHFTGENGSLVVKLFYPSLISGFTIIHPRACQLPAGHEVSAPKDFEVVGMENNTNEADPISFGNFTYEMGGPSAQNFPVQFCSREKYLFVEFKFTSNHGNPNYTSLYKVQIHGDSGRDFPESVGDDDGNEA